MVGNVNLTVTPSVEEEGKIYGVRISWKADTNTRLEDCIDFGNQSCFYENKILFVYYDVIYIFFICL